MTPCRGIVRYRTYLPAWRLQHESIATMLGSGPRRGARVVAGADEDTLTLAVTAAQDVVRPGVRRLILSTSTPVFAQKSNVSVVAAALDLEESVHTVDMIGSVASAIGALLWSVESDGDVAVAIADQTDGFAGSVDERSGGDAASAFLVGGDDVVAEFISFASTTVEVNERWRAPGSPYSNAWEERFGEHALAPPALRAIETALERAGVVGTAIDHSIIVGSNQRAVRAVKAARLVPATSLVDDLVDELGYAGSAHWSSVLCEVLDRARPGQLILVSIVGDGGAAMILRRTDVAHPAAGPTAAAMPRSVDYATYLSWRGRLVRDSPRRPPPAAPAAPPSLRTVRWKYGFVAGRCASCGERHLPPGPVCSACGSRSVMESERMADVPAIVTTFTVDHLAVSAAPPLVAGVIDFEGGGRLRCEIADARPDDVSVGTPVRMAFRRMSTPDGRPNYFWKATVSRRGAH